MSKYFEGIDFDNFWNNQKYYLENCVGNKLDDETIRYVEKELGYKLPESYIELMKIQNGGAPIKNTWINKDAKPNEVDTVVMTNFYSVGSEKADSLLGKFGNKFWFTEWEYPNIGVVIAETISGGHQLIYLDYSECANNGIPKVAMINQESDYHKTILSNTFEDFVLSLIEEDELYDDECD